MINETSHQTLFHDIPHNILATLLDREGSPGSLSPRSLMGPAGPVTKHQLAELYAGHFVQLPSDSEAHSTPEFAQAAQVLLNPLTTITFRVWTDEDLCAETSILFPGDPLEDGGVILNQIDQAYRMVSPIATKDVLGLIAQAIPPASDKPPAMEFEGHFDTPVVAVLFGLIDMIRLQENAEAGRPGFTAAEISATLKGQWGLTGFHHLITYVTTVGLMPGPPALNEVEFSLDRLVDARVLQKTESNEFVPAPSLEPLVRLMPDIVPGLQWQRVSLVDELNGSEDLLTSNRIFVFGEESLILMFAPMPQGRIYVASITAAALTEFIVSEMATILPRAAVEQMPPKAAAAVQCLGCEAVVDVSKKFCTHCGAVRCPQCQNYVKKSKFCRSCGQKL